METEFSKNPNIKSEVLATSEVLKYQTSENDFQKETFVKAILDYAGYSWNARTGFIGLPQRP